MNYTHAEAKDARRKLISMLPENITVYTGVLNMGRTLSVLVSNALAEMKTYEFGWQGRTLINEGRQGPEFSNQAALAIADEWANGSIFTKVYAPVKAEAPTPYITTKDALTVWVAAARKNDTACYFRGSVAKFRADAPRRIVELQGKADAAPPNRPRPSVERAELARLQKTQEMLTHIDLFMRKDLITLSQRPDLEGNGTAYLAIRKGKPMSVSHPQEESRLKKLLGQAIRTHWAKYKGREFDIASIDWEGGVDNTHETTAIVLIYKKNQQDPLPIRIPARDLGNDQKQWPFILANKAKKAINMLEAREGRSKRMKTSLDDM